MPTDEETPLLWSGESYHRRSSSAERPQHYHNGGQLKHTDARGNHPHAQFCALVGCPPSDADPKDKFEVPPKSLYARATSGLRSQRLSYNANAALSNLLLLSQVMLGAALTALGASESSHILIACFGALNTVIAGLIAYLKSRGQPMRARMYRDDLERVVDEIENSEVMWRGISEGAHGYDEIDTDEVTVRSEVARLTRLYERAIRLNGMNNPDMYMAGGGMFDGNTSGGARPNRGGAVGATPGTQGAALPTVVAPGAPQPSAENAGPAVPLVENPDDVAPATKADVKDDKKEDKPESQAEGKKPAPERPSDTGDPAEDSSTSKPVTDPKPDPPKTDLQSSQPAQPAQSSLTVPPLDDPDASPATAARLKPKRTKSDKERDDVQDRMKVAGDESE